MKEMKRPAGSAPPGVLFWGGHKAKPVSNGRSRQVQAFKTAGGAPAIAGAGKGAGGSGSHHHVRFYSDHVSDAPTLDWADEAFAVNPHAPLLALAREKGWDVLRWR